MEFLFDSFRDASRYTAHIAKSYKSSPRLTRRGSKFVVILPDGLKSKLGKEAVTVAAVFACLMAGQSLMDTPETDLVLDAIHRSSNALAGMSEQEIGEYLNSLNPEQLQGLANNVKGIYHELSFVEAHNLEGGDTVAAVFSETNHAGADVYFTDSGNVVAEVQLKATENVEHVQAHLEAYPDVEVLATEEVASILEGVESSGFSNAELTAEVNDALQAIIDPSILEQAGDMLGQVAAGIFELLTW